MRHYPEHEDLGIDADADRTEDLRPGKSEAPEIAVSEASKKPAPESR